MSTVSSSLRGATRLGAAAVGAGVASWGAYSAITWARYGHADPARHPRDELLDRFMPRPEVDEYHSVVVDAPAELTYEVAKQVDMQSSPIVRSIFWLRMLPAMLQGRPAERAEQHGLIEETLAIGYGILADEPGHEIVIGTYTQPWHEEVAFHPLPPEEFAPFSEPGYVKIAVAVGAEPLGPQRSRFVTRTRVVCTDAQARRRFRLYWAPLSAGIIVIRYTLLPTVKRAAERQARLAAA